MPKPTTATNEVFASESGLLRDKNAAPADLSAPARAALARVCAQSNRAAWTAASAFDHAVLAELHERDLITGSARIYATKAGHLAISTATPCEKFAAASAEVDIRMANLWSASPTAPATGVDDDTYAVWDKADRAWRKAYLALKAERSALVSPCGGCLTCTPVEVSDPYEGTTVEPHCPQDDSACEQCIEEGDFMCRDCRQPFSPTSRWTAPCRCDGGRNDHRDQYDTWREARV